MPRTQDLKALRRMISEAHQILQTSPELPQGRTVRALELLGDSVVLADYLLTVEPAAIIGKDVGQGDGQARAPPPVGENRPPPSRNTGGAPGGFYDQARAWRLERRDFAQRSTYFEVKAGRGGKRARRRVDRYLRKLQI